MGNSHVKLPEGSIKHVTCCQSLFKDVPEKAIWPSIMIHNASKSKCDHLSSMFRGSLVTSIRGYIWAWSMVQSCKCARSMLGTCCQCNTILPTDTCFTLEEHTLMSHSLCPVQTSLFGDVWCMSHSWFTFPKRVKMLLIPPPLRYQSIRSSTPHMTQVCRSYVILDVSALLCWTYYAYS